MNEIKAKHGDIDVAVRRLIHGKEAFLHGDTQPEKHRGKSHERSRCRATLLDVVIHNASRIVILISPNGVLLARGNIHLIASANDLFASVNNLYAFDNKFFAFANE